MRYIGYVRVSTKEQGTSGLGLAAQKMSIENFVKSVGGELVDVYEEVESGKRNDRPKLQEAISYSRLTGAKLIIAKLDRLSRSLHFITSLAESKIDFVICDLPGCDSFTVNLYGALAQRERELISSRTKAALAVRKENGKPLGNPKGEDNISDEAKKRGQESSLAIRSKKADDFAAEVMPHIQGLIDEGASLRTIATALNAKNILTARGKEWTAQGVKNLLER